MIKYAITAVPMSRSTRRRTGKSHVVVVDAEEGQTPQQIEAIFELLSRSISGPNILKVLDVRPLEAASQEGIHIDTNIRDADWPKRTPDRIR
jgi:hypothetical protein